MIRALFTAALLLAAACTQASQGSLVELSLRDLDTGQELPIYWQAGRAHVPGSPGHRYAVIMSNRSAGRVLAVLSVDGVNAVTGQTANPDQSGYVLGPYQKTEIRGWRKDLSSIAEFVFTDLGDSYAARTGRPDNVGVIGVAVFRERPVYREPPPAIARDFERRQRGAGAAKSESSESADSASKRSAQPSPAAPLARQELGTGHGERRYDPISRTGFDRASKQPDQVTSLFYDDRNALIARGVIPPPRHQRPRYRGQPDPFPLGFVPDPPRWR